MKHSKLLFAVFCTLFITCTSVSAQKSFMEIVYPNAHAQKVMANNELERNEVGRNTIIHANPLLLNGKLMDYNKFDRYTKGQIALVKGKPETNEQKRIPFRISVRRNGMIIKDFGQKYFYDFEISDVLVLCTSGDQIIINPVNKADYKAKRILNIVEDLRNAMPERWICKKIEDC